MRLRRLYDAHVKPKRPVALAKRPKRRRRTAEEARSEILRAAEAQFIESGPASIRLQDIAAVVGISHPAVLHHFGSKEELVRAVVERALKGLQLELMQTLGRASRSPTVGDMGILVSVSTLLREQRYGRLIGWLLLSGYDPLGAESMRENWPRIVNAMHALRPSRDAPLEDTRFTIALLGFAVFAESIAGSAVFSVAGYAEGDPEPANRFREWLAKLLREHLSR